MRISNFKRLAVVLVFMVLFGIVGCGKSKEEKAVSTESKVNLTRVLKYKDSNVGDNSAIVNFNVDDGISITYERSDLVNAHKDDFGDNLEEITKDKSSLENFIKNNKK